MFQAGFFPTSRQVCSRQVLFQLLGRYVPDRFCSNFEAGMFQAGFFQLLGKYVPGRFFPTPRQVYNMFQAGFFQLLAVMFQAGSVPASRQVCFMQAQPGLAGFV